MALNASTFRNVFGLVTELDVIDPNQVPPNSLLDVKNLSFEFDGYAVSRKGHPVWYEAPSSYRTFPYVSLSLRPLQTNYLNAVYLKDPPNTVMGVQIDNTQDDTVCIKQYTGSPSAGIRTAASASGYLSADVNPGNFGVPRWIDSGQQVFLNTFSGLFSSSSATSFKSFSKVVPPTIMSITAAASSIAAAGGVESSKNWLLPGYKTTVVAIVKEYFSDDSQLGFIESMVSPEVDILNLGEKAAVNLSSVVIDTTNIRDLSTCYLEIYRTLQYKPFDDPANGNVPPPTDRRKCFEAQLTSASTTGTVTTFSNLLLDMNDDFVSGQAQIYTDSNVEGRISENLMPPAAKDTVLYKGYTIYGNVRTQATAKLSLTGLPAATGEKLIVNGSSAALTLQTNASSSDMISSSANGVLTTTNASFKGTTPSNSLVIRPQAQTGKSYAVKEYFVTTTAQFQTVGSGTNTKTIRVTPASGFDVDPFQTPGALAIVQYGAASTAGQVIDIMYYRDLESVPGSGYVDFFECSTLSNFGSTPFTASGSTFALFYLAGAVKTGDNGFEANFPVYPIGSAASGAGAVGWSLLPTYSTYPTAPFIDFPVGRTTVLSYTGGVVKATIDFFGITWKSAAKQLDDCARQAVIDLSSARSSPALYYSVGPEIAQILIYTSYVSVPVSIGSPTVDVSGQTSGGGSPTATYSEAITTSSITISNQTSYPNALIISKYNRPHAVPLEYVLNPRKIGDTNKKILRLGVNTDQLYVFKESEGIYRVELVEGTTIPALSSVVQVDNTVWMTASESLQTIQGVLVFLGNKGVFTLANNELRLISGRIASLIKDEFTKCVNDANLGTTADERTEKITSFANESRRQYGIYFPTSQKTYVFDFGVQEWTIYDLKIDASCCLPDGRLVTATRDGMYYWKRVPSIELVAETYYTISIVGSTNWTALGASSNTVGVTFKASAPGAGTGYAYTSSWSLIRRDQFTTGYNDTVDQIDDVIALTGAAVNGSSASVTLTRTALTSATTNLANLTARFGSDKIYYKSGSSYYPMTLSSANFATGSVVYNFDSTAPSAFNASTDSLVRGVNTYAVFNRFFAGGPHTLSRFAEVHPQLPGTHNNMRYLFESNSPALAFAGATTTISQSTDVARVLVTPNERRGRWLAVKMIHDYPYQFCRIAGYSVVSRDMDTHRTVLYNV